MNLKRTLLITALALALSTPALADCGNEPPAGSTPPDVVTPVAHWIRRLIFEGIVELPGGVSIAFNRATPLPVGVAIPTEAAR